jgi:multidrug efflux pump subunit AcrA (membrane-fusion protein)
LVFKAARPTISLPPLARQGLDDPAMIPSHFIKPAVALAFFVLLAGADYWWEHRPEPAEKDTAGEALVVVTKSTNACFSDQVRVTGFVVPRREAVVGADQEGSKVTDLFVREGDTVTDNQELARLSAPQQQPGQQQQQGRNSGPVSLRAPAPGLITEVRTMVGAPASPQAGPMFRIAINNELELEAEVPSVHLPKLNPGATVRITRDNAPDLIGRVRLVSPQVDRSSQLGRVRIALTNNPSLKVGMFARANIDAKRSCGVAVPRTAIDHLTVQVIKGNTVETRKVQVGLTSDANTQILEGLDVGETVVADAGSSLHDGDQVKAMFADELDRRVR